MQESNPPEFSPRKAEAFRPCRRPPLAKLTIFDDGIKEGEVIRLRADEYLIGREQSDVKIVHDAMIDSPHLKIRREAHGQSYRWTIADLDSRFGLWMRVRKIELRSTTEFLVGRGRYRFRAASEESSASLSNFDARIIRGSFFGQSLDTNLNGFSSIYPTLESLEYSSESDETIINKVFLIDDDYWIGRDATCALRSSSDTFLMPKHVHVFREGQKWFAETLPGPNGMWIKTMRIVVDHSSSFQIGEQRFRLICEWRDDD